MRVIAPTVVSSQQNNPRKDSETNRCLQSLLPVTHGWDGADRLDAISGLLTWR